MKKRTVTKVALASALLWTYRTRTDRKLDLISSEHEYKEAGKYEILVKVVDIFGNDTSLLLEWKVK